MLINKLACKKAVLSVAASTRGSRFNRVGSDVYDHLEATLMNTIKGLVHSHPSVGKTIMMGSKKRTKQDRADLEDCNLYGFHDKLEN